MIVIPAKSGFELLNVWVRHVEDFFVSRMPIIAWRCDEEGIQPLVYGTTTGINKVDEAVKHPNGVVVSRKIGTYYSEDTWLANAKLYEEATPERQEYRRRLQKRA